MRSSTAETPRRDRFICPCCKRRGTITVLAKNIEEKGGMALLIKGKAPKVLQRPISVAGQFVRHEVIVLVTCPRCKQQFPVPGHLLVVRRR